MTQTDRERKESKVGTEVGEENFLINKSQGNFFQKNNNIKICFNTSMGPERVPR